jgi:hypothetical protein
VSDEKTVMSFDAAMKVGDRAFAEVVVDHDGTLAFPTSSGGVARTPWSPEFTGIRVRGIVRAPVPREVVAMEYEVVQREDVTAGDFADCKSGLQLIHDDDVSDTRRERGYVAARRFLRPIKKP